MNIRNAKAEDLELLCELDYHIAPQTLAKSVVAGNILIAEEDGELMGWLRWNLFWDNTPFMNLLYIREAYRDQGIGLELVKEWEAQRKLEGYDSVMTSTAANEYAQHFYEKLGYKAVGGFLLPGDPYEVVFVKEL